MARLEQLIFVTINIPPAIFMDIQSFIDNDPYRGPILYKRLRQEYALVQETAGCLACVMASVIWGR